VGDQLLASFCKNTTNIFDSQFLYFRTGGDGIVFILQTNDLQDIDIILRNNRADLEDRMYQTVFTEFGMSFGTTHLSETKTVSQCLGLADERMYTDKGH
jgi:GGDEF domain-containing protein